MKVPDVGDGRSQLDVIPMRSRHVGSSPQRHPAFADDAKTHPLYLPEVALPVPGGVKIFSQKGPSLLRFEGAVVDVSGFLDLTIMAPLADLVGARQSDAELVVDVRQHWFSFPLPGGYLCLKSERFCWCGSPAWLKSSSNFGDVEEVVASGTSSRSMPVLSWVVLRKSANSMTRPSPEGTSTFRAATASP